MGCFLLLLGLACGYWLSGIVTEMKQQTESLGKNIRKDLAQIEAMTATSTLFGSLLHVHAVASLRRIHTTVKHELMQCQQQHASGAPK
jgi:SUMO ligase MMS21 Smc5/6 complex component